jgi:hypothetical protein
MMYQPWMIDDDDDDDDDECGAVSGMRIDSRKPKYLQKTTPVALCQPHIPLGSNSDCCSGNGSVRSNGSILHSKYVFNFLMIKVEEFHIWHEICHTERGHIGDTIYARKIKKL